MWGTIDEVLANLARLHPVGDDLALLTAAFGPPRFVYLHRDDLVAQAVSRLRAEQTGVWSEAIGSEPSPGAAPRFDAGAIDGYVREAQEHNAAWQAWFRATGVEPIEVVYEDLASRPAGTTRRIIDLLEISIPPETLLVPAFRRLSDALNEKWAREYRVATGPP
jgi:LPS sulfotransferase NodH